MWELFIWNKKCNGSSIPFFFIIRKYFLKFLKLYWQNIARIICPSCGKRHYGNNKGYGSWIIYSTKPIFCVKIQCFQLYIHLTYKRKCLFPKYDYKWKGCYATRLRISVIVVINNNPLREICCSLQYLELLIYFKCI